LTDTIAQKNSIRLDKSTDLTDTIPARDSIRIRLDMSLSIKREKMEGLVVEW